MSTQHATFNPETDNLEALQEQLHKATAKARSGQLPAAPQHIVAKTITVDTFGNGETRITSYAKDGSATAYATPARQGMIHVPGMGETSIAAAKAGGLIPHTWNEGDPLPFELAPTAGGSNKAAGDKPSATGSDASAAGDGPSVMEHRAKVASSILSGVDQFHGSHVTDKFLNDAVNSDELPDPDTLPAGVTGEMAKQVYAGFMAQAENTLSGVGANVALLSEFCTDDELRQARQATVFGASDRLQEIGKAAIERLARMPEQDPEGFREMVEGMTAEERKMLHKRGDGGWTLRTPGHPEMSFGAAVLAGLVRI